MKMVLILSIILLNILFLSLKSWIWYWVLIELMLYFLIILILMSLASPPKMMIKFFLIQSIMSIILCVSLISTAPWGLMSLILAISIKIGLFPFHSWVFKLINLYFTPLTAFLVLGLQKLPPLLIFSLCPSNFLTFLLIMISLFGGGLIGFSMISLTNILISSSIFYNSWLLISSLPGQNILFLFLTFYLILMFCFLMWNFMQWNWFLSASSFIFVIGCPPFLAFSLKMGLFFSLMKLINIQFLIFLLPSFFLPFFFYFNFLFFSKLLL